MAIQDNNATAHNNQPKKRVLFVVTQSEFGGAQRFLFNLISGLDKDRYEIRLTAGNLESDGLLFSLKEKNIQIAEIKSLCREINFWKDIRSLKQIEKEIAEYKPNILFLASSKAGFVGSLAAKRIGFTGKVIYRIGGWTFNDPWPGWKKIIFRLMEKYSAGWKDIIVLNNERDFKQAQKYGIKPRESLVIVPNGLDIYKMDLLSKEEARLKFFEKISRQSGKVFQVKTIIGTIANFYPAKGLDYLIKTAEFFKNDPDIIFVIIGDGPERPGLEELIKKGGLEHKIFLIGYLANASRYLAGFDVFVLPSVKEGFPWAVIEAMSAKLPVVATNVGAIPEIIQSGKNGIIVSPGKPEIMANAIKMALEGPNSAQELGIQAHQSVLFKYRLDRMVSQIEALF